MKETKHTAHAHFHRSSSPEAKRLPVIVLLPGGASFSGLSWGPIDLLLTKFDVITVDPPGTGDTPRLSQYRFEEIISSIERSLIPFNERVMVFAGVSFGVVYAAEIASRGNLNAHSFFAFSGPIDYKSFQMVDDPIALGFTEEMEKKEKIFLENPSDETWRDYLSAIAPIYFTEPFIEPGRNSLVQDKSEYLSYLQVFFEYLKSENIDLIKRIKALDLPKVFVVGSHERLFPLLGLKEHAISLNSAFEIVEGVGHLVNFEKPQATLDIFERHIKNKSNLSISS